MAVIGTDEDQNKINQPQSSSNANAHATANGAGFVAGGGAHAGGSAGATPAQQPGGGGYTNLTQYLAANQGSGGITGQAASNVVTQSANAANKAQNEYSQAANNEISKNTANLGVNQQNLNAIRSGAATVDQNVLKDINSRVWNASSTLPKDYTKLTSDQLNDYLKQGQDATKYDYKVNDFSGVGYNGPGLDKLSVAYTGPQNTSAFGADASAAQQRAMQANDIVAGNAANAQGGQAGVSALLRQAYQQPNYTQGENSLDAFLAGGTNVGRQALSDVSGLGKESQASYENLNKALGSQIQKANETAANTNAAYKKAIDESMSNASSTRKNYEDAQAAAREKSIANQREAQAAAKAAQAEIDRRTQYAKDHAAPTQLIGQKSLGSAISGLGGKVVQAGKNVVNPVLSDLNRLAPNITNSLSNVGKIATGALKGDKGAAQKLGDTILSGGLNILAPKTSAAVAGATHKAVSDTGKALKKAFGFAHGGQVPSYSKLTKMLKKG